VLTKEHLMHRLYHDDDRPELRVLDVFICRLRRKLAARGATPIIRTVRGRGYLAALPGAARPGAALASQTVG
jgi:two-component system cell cycle response regulator CtrA